MKQQVICNEIISFVFLGSNLLVEFWCFVWSLLCLYIFVVDDQEITQDTSVSCCHSLSVVRAVLVWCCWCFISSSISGYRDLCRAGPTEISTPVKTVWALLVQPVIAAGQASGEWNVHPPPPSPSPSLSYTASLNQVSQGWIQSFILRQMGAPVFLSGFLSYFYNQESWYCWMLWRKYYLICIIFMYVEITFWSSFLLRYDTMAQ